MLSSRNVARFGEFAFKREIWDLKICRRRNACGRHIFRNPKILILVYGSIVFRVFVVFSTFVSCTGSR
jgi:hypothetical protein